MSRKRKMSAPGEEQPSSSRPATIGGNVTGDAVTKVIGPIATTGRPHTAPAGPTEPVKMEESEEMDTQNQMVPCDQNTGMGGGIGGRSKTLKGAIGRNDNLVVPPKPTKKTTKRSRILTSADDDGIVVGGRGGRGQSAYMYACNSGGHGTCSSTNALASSYYLYHGHRHANTRSASSLDSFHDCLSTSHNKEKKEDGNGRANKVSGDSIHLCIVLFLNTRACDIIDAAYVFCFGFDLNSHVHSPEPNYLMYIPE